MAEPKDTLDRIWRANVAGAFKALATEIKALKEQAAEQAKLKALEESVAELHRVIKHKPTQVELRASFVDKLEKGVPAVTLDEVAAYHGKYPKWVLRRETAGAIQRLPGYGRRAMFDPRVACRLRPERKEG